MKESIEFAIGELQAMLDDGLTPDEQFKHLQEAENLLGEAEEELKKSGQIKLTEKARAEMLFKCQSKVAFSLVGQDVSYGYISEMIWQGCLYLVEKIARCHSTETARKEFIYKQLHSGLYLCYLLMGKNDDQIKQSIEVFNNTILKNGAAQESITDYFTQMMKKDLYYPEGNFKDWQMPTED